MSAWGDLAMPPLAVQAEALREAFPAYAVSVIRRGSEVRLEVVSRTGGSLYCLISGDPREIWRELRNAA